ncbi:hypothetical protein TWF694_009276 [Orbilia ellipsospora]|uniref:RING-type domain-containing protein n=1 Tax=Orbilia ellipsospora TaxID=2528407 RepID=A0AAV9XFY9_9PEZI
MAEHHHKLRGDGLTREVSELNWHFADDGDHDVPVSFDHDGRCYTAKSWLDVRSKCHNCKATNANANMTKLRCGHKHCARCLYSSYQTVLEDPGTYPPKCCQAFDAAKTTWVLSQKDILTLGRVKERAESRKLVGCFSCGNILSESTMRSGLAYCHRCRAVTCITCGRKGHKSDCTKGVGVVEMLDQAWKGGWRSCRRCGFILRRKDPRHPKWTCRCGARICTICGTGLYREQCPQCDERKKRGAQGMDRAAIFNQSFARYHDDKMKGYRNYGDALYQIQRFAHATLEKAWQEAGKLWKKKQKKMRK